MSQRPGAKLSTKNTPEHIPLQPVWNLSAHTQIGAVSSAHHKTTPFWVLILGSIYSPDVESVQLDCPVGEQL